MNRTQRRTISVNGATVHFWVAQGPVLARPALIAENSDGGRILEDPATREGVELYSERELIRLYETRTS